MFKQKLDLLGNIFGVLGAASCVLGVFLRIYLGPGGHQIYVAPRNVLLGGVALMVFGCWLKLTAR